MDHKSGGFALLGVVSETDAAPIPMRKRVLAINGVSVGGTRVPVVNEWVPCVVQSYARMRPSVKSLIIFQLVAGTNLGFLGISESENDTLTAYLEGGFHVSCRIGCFAVYVCLRFLAVKEINQFRDRSKRPHSYARAVYLICVGAFSHLK